MDMGDLLGALIKSQSAKRGGGGGGGGLAGLLEGLLGAGKQSAPRAPQTERRPAPERAPAGRPNFDFGGAKQAPPSELDNERAKMLICAMVGAAKSDGQLDKKEQETILSQLGDVTQEEIDFLKGEFAKPLDVRAFAWDVPIGFEEQVYGFSLMSIDLDRNKEATYLRDLAHGLRLPPEQCNAIHERLKEPQIF